MSGKKGMIRYSERIKEQVRKTLDTTNWGGEFENVAILVAIAVNEDGYREVLGAAEGMKEDKASWVNFFQWPWFGRG